MIRAAVVVVFALLAQAASAHHGGGTFDNSREIELKGVLTRLDLVNPHSWIYFDVSDVLIVDTVGFTSGVLSPPVLNSNQLYVVERFSLDPKTMALTRSYSAEDPVYFTGQYAGSDTIQVADLPYAPDKCNELGFLDYSKQGQRQGAKKP